MHQASSSLHNIDHGAELLLGIFNVVVKTAASQQRFQVFGYSSAAVEAYARNRAGDAPAGVTVMPSVQTSATETASQA